MRFRIPVLAVLASARLVLPGHAEAPEVETWPAPGNVQSLREGRSSLTGAALSRRPMTEDNLATGKIPTPRVIARVRGLLTPPVTGDYRFAVAGDDEGELHLADDASPFRSRPIAAVGRWTAERKWTDQAGQISAPIRLEAGKPVYFETWVFNDGNTGHLEVGWQPPGAPELVPLKLQSDTGVAQVTRSLARQDDADDNGLPDAWQREQGLAAGETGAWADPDHDGVDNREEFQAGTHPKQADTRPGMLWRETWSGFLWAETMRQRLRFGEATYPKPPAHALTAGLTPMANKFPVLQKFRGYLTPPETGAYRFHLAGQGRVRLTLSPDERVLTKRIVTDGGLTMQGQPVLLDRPGAFPDSAAISLESGQRYYFEVYYWIERKPLELRFEWTTPLGRREAVPSSALSSFHPSVDDVDQDDLPDAWERDMGLSLAGSDPAGFATGDPDYDGLNSGEEFLRGTNPRAADTDRDGVDDGTESQLLGTSPRDPTRPLEAGPPIDLFAAQPLTYGWSKAAAGSYADAYNQPKPQPDPNQPSLVNHSGCGSAEWSFTTDRDGSHLVRCEFQPLGHTPGDITARSQWWIDGEALPEIVTQAPNLALQRAAFLTPRLTAGRHTLKLRLRTTHQLTPTRIFTLQMSRVTDAAVADVTRHLRRDNRFTRGTGDSLTSPACVEAATRLEEMPRWSVGGQPATASRADAWNSTLDVPLPEDGTPVPVEFAAEKNALVVTDSVRWQATDVLQRPALVVRQGDRLRLTVATGNEVGRRSLEIDGQSHSLAAGECRIWTGEKPGRHRVSGTWQAAGDTAPREGVLEITVVPPFAAKDAGWTRVNSAGCWIDPLAPEQVVDGGDRVNVSRHRTGRIGLFPKKAGDWVLPVRAGADGPRLGAITVHACQFNIMSRGFHRLWETSALVENPPPGAKLHYVIDNPQGWLPWASENGEHDAWQPLTNLNEEGLIFFHAKSMTPQPTHYLHDLYLSMPDGSEW